MERNTGLLAVFTYVDDLLNGLRTLRQGTYRIEHVFSPLSLPEVQDILGKKPSPVRLITLIGGTCVALGLVGLAVYAHLSFHLITGGKPVLPWIPWVVVCFEGTILGGVLFTIVAWVVKGHLPRLHPAKGYDVAFSQDRFGVLVACTDREEEEIAKLLQDAGAEEVRHVGW